MSLIKLFLGGNNLVLSRPESFWSVTSRLGTGKWLSLFYSVAPLHPISILKHWVIPISLRNLGVISICATNRSHSYVFMYSQLFPHFYRILESLPYTHCVLELLPYLYRRFFTTYLRKPIIILLPYSGWFPSLYRILELFPYLYRSFPPHIYVNL